MNAIVDSKVSTEEVYSNRGDERDSTNFLNTGKYISVSNTLEQSSNKVGMGVRAMLAFDPYKFWLGIDCAKMYNESVGL